MEIGKVEFKTSVNLDINVIRGLLCSAFEGGSNYWYFIDRWELRPGLTLDDFKEGGSQQPDNYWHWSQLIPTTAGCSLFITDREDEGANPKEYQLNLEAIRRGLKFMADDYPKHFADVVNENDDAETGDVFLQCCLFGEVIYG